jgi:hypothetical protein
MSAGFFIIRTQSISDAWNKCSANTFGMQELNLQYSGYRKHTSYPSETFGYAPPHVLSKHLLCMYLDGVARTVFWPIMTYS